jgi:DNA-binding PadR family transcriptional regulator
VWIDVLLLAHLAAEPAHGYELRRRVETSSGRALSNNSLYPALRRFTEAGAVTRSAEEQAGRPARHVYTITGVGRELLHDMLADLPDDLAADGAEFLARVGHFDLLTPAERITVLDARERALTAVARRSQELVEQAPEHSWGRVVLDEVLRRTRDEQHWITEVRVRASTEDGERS